MFWSLSSELLFLFTFTIVSSTLARFYYLYIVVAGQPNPYTLDYYITDILFPAYTIILPILIFGRFAFGKYKEKKIEESKIEIKGEGTYEGLRRNKLSVIADEFPELLRTHRSYIINPYHFQQWKTEKGKLYIELSSSIFVPVSNTYKDEVKSILNSATT